MHVHLYFIIGENNIPAACERTWQLALSALRWLSKTPAHMCKCHIHINYVFKLRNSPQPGSIFTRTNSTQPPMINQQTVCVKYRITAEDDVASQAGTYTNKRSHSVPGERAQRCWRRWRCTSATTYGRRRRWSCRCRCGLAE